MKIKKSYKRPELRRVKLDVKSSVLATCRTSAVADVAMECQSFGGACWSAL